LKGLAHLSMICFRIFGLLLLLTVLPYYSSMAFDTLEITARLDTLKKRITGTVEYRLPSEPKLTTFEFQLYPNLYSSEDSPYLKKNHQLLNRLRQTRSWGGMEIDSVLLDNENVFQMVQVNLTKGVLKPDNETSLNGKTISIYFKTYIPEFGDRLFYTGGEYMLGNWFPYPAIIRKDGSWYNPDYRAFAEPIGEYYHYEVDFSFPGNYIAAAPAESVENGGDDSLSVLHYSFGPAHDFAMALSPYYLVDSTICGTTMVKIFYRDYEKIIINRIKTAVQHTLEYMSENIGNYCYSDFSVVLTNTSMVGGVEYPGLIALSSPRGGIMATRFYESLVAHETIHQWFYGMVASNQVESPWMDESVTNYFTHKILKHYWGESANLFEYAGLEFAERDNLRILAKTVSNKYNVNCPTYAFWNDADYFNTIYSKGPLALETFDNIMGDSISDVFWRCYFNMYRFKHPEPDDFIRLAGEIGGEDIRDALLVLLNDADEIDYAVNNLENNKLDSAAYEVGFILEKKGNMDLPVEYRVILYNGDTLEGQWHPTYNTMEIILNTIAPAISVTIDPCNVYAIDDDLLNNSISSDNDNRPCVRLSSGIMFLLESLLSFLGGM